VVGKAATHGIKIVGEGEKKVESGEERSLGLSRGRYLGEKESGENKKGGENTSRLKRYQL